VLHALHDVWTQGSAHRVGAGLKADTGISPQCLLWVVEDGGAGLVRSESEGAGWRQGPMQKQSKATHQRCALASHHPPTPQTHLDLRQIQIAIHKLMCIIVLIPAQQRTFELIITELYAQQLQIPAGTPTSLTARHVNACLCAPPPAAHLRMSSSVATPAELRTYSSSRERTLWASAHRPAGAGGSSIQHYYP
jgi:hypothetical protein